MNQNSIKVMLADDKPEMRMILNKVIMRMEGFAVTGQAGDGEELMTLFERDHADIVFLDIQMPKLDGLECASRIFEIAPRTALVFATAFEQYRPEAFAVYAFDYLVKPFEISRVEETLKRYQSFWTNPPEPSQEPLLHLSGKWSDKLMVRSRDSVSIVDTERIRLIQREDRMSAIYTDRDKYMCSDSLGDLEARLNPSQFMRCHKSYIINLSHISTIYPYGRWTHLVKLRDVEVDALMTSDKFDELEKRFRF